jgi:hypothetical protein
VGGRGGGRGDERLSCSTNPSVMQKKKCKKVKKKGKGCCIYVSVYVYICEYICCVCVCTLNFVCVCVCVCACVRVHVYYIIYYTPDMYPTYHINYKIHTQNPKPYTLYTGQFGSSYPKPYTLT